MRIVHKLCDRSSKSAFVICRYVDCRFLCGEPMLRQIKGNNRLSQRHVLHNLEHSGMVGVRIRRRGIHTDIRGGEIAAKFLAEDEPHELHVFVKAKLMCLRLQACPGIPAADEYAMKISSAQIMDKVLKNPQQTVDTVLKAHDAHKADDRLSHPS